VGHAAGGLQQQEALFRRGEKEPPAVRIMNNLVEIKLRIVPEDGELKVVLAFGFGVATSGAAPGFGQQRHDLVDEAYPVAMGRGRRSLRSLSQKKAARQIPQGAKGGEDPGE
jgi:hypothetical protein